MTAMVQSMRGLLPGEEAVIEKITVAGEIGRRIRDMGLIPGTRFLVIGRAPLRDPVEIKVRGCNLALRNKEADYILIENRVVDRLVRLADVGSGGKVRLASIKAGQGAVARLESMGLFLNSEIEVISNAQPGPVLVSLGDRRLTLGRGIAEKVWVE